jgi:hypothetical protein
MEIPEHVLLAVRNFLNAETKRATQQQSPTCGSVMKHLDSVVWILDTEEKWQIFSSPLQRVPTRTL